MAVDDNDTEFEDSVSTPPEKLKVLYLRTPESLHQLVADTAKLENVSINDYVLDLLWKLLTEGWTLTPPESADESPIPR